MPRLWRHRISGSQTAVAARSQNIPCTLQGVFWKRAFGPQRGPIIRHKNPLRVAGRKRYYYNVFLAVIGAGAMDFARSKDESLLHFYESVRRQVEADKLSGGRYRFAGDAAKEYADRIREELDRRRLGFTPIDWPR
jgi:hypothetical protein